jgi:MoxR-like ATPase
MLTQTKTQQTTNPPKTPDFSNPNPASNPVEEARKRVLALEEELNKVVIGREEVVRALMLSLVSRQHIVVIGPPGTAKSYMAMTLAKLLQARHYVYLMTRFTNFDEIFGRIDVLALQRNELRRKWSNIIEAEIVFLDELFKANSAILNALLSLLQERQVYDPLSGEAIPAKLWTLVAASNEVPADDELMALYDRFAVRIFINYLDDDSKILAALQARWRPSSGTAMTPVANMEDVKILHDYAIQLLSKGRVKNLGEVVKLYFVNTVPLIGALRSKGIIISDRTTVEKAAVLYGAYLALYGVTPDNIINAPLEIAPYLARTQQELRDIQKVIEDSLGEAAELAKKLEDAKKLQEKGQQAAAHKLFKEVATYDVTRLTTKPWIKARVEAIVRTAQEHLQRMQRP